MAVWGNIRRGQSAASGLCGWTRASDGALPRALEGHTVGVSSVAFSPDGEIIASGVTTGRGVPALTRSQGCSGKGVVVVTEELYILHAAVGLERL